MDHNFDIVSQVDIKGLLEKSVIATNVTVQKWKTENKVKANDIESIEVRSILMGFLKKYIVKDKQDFKKFRGLINISIDGGNKYITSVRINNVAERYFRQKYIIDELERVSPNINYNSLFPKKTFIEESLEKGEKKSELIDFSSIKAIKF